MKKKKYNLYFLILSFIFFVLPNSSFAITLNKTSYSFGEGMRFVGEGGPWVVYDLVTKNSIGGRGSYSEVAGDELGYSEIAFVNGGSYSIIETTEDAVCENNNFTYEQCRGSEYFVGEFLFRVANPPGYIPEPETPVSGGGGGGPTAYRPEIGIYSPIEGKTYGNLIDVIYEATDKNDEVGQKSLGLTQTPVTIFYSRTSDTRQKVQLGSNLPAKGIFKWNTKDLPEGDNYNIIIDAVDNSGEIGESVSGDFSIDHTVPIFTVLTDPPVSRGEDVKIMVESTKDLSEPPTVKVAQNEFNFFDVQMTGSGRIFEGVYKVIGGYDGPAEISVQGKDLSGNISDVIASGGQFSVGVLPPPKPIILSPIDKEIAPNGIINIKGKARRDTEVILSVNGSEKFSTNPDKDGLFSFSNIKLKPDFNYGNNIISIISKDAARNISESASLSLKYNISPEIFIDSPVNGQVLGTTTVVSIKATDKNKDKLKFSYEVSKDKGLSWITLADSISSLEYVWDTTMFPDGDYYLRATVNDGTSKKNVVVENLIIKNLLPTFSFDGGERASTNKKEYTITGNVVGSTKLSPRSNIVLVEYSLNGGKDWLPANLLSGSSNLPEQKFSFSLNGLEEGKYDVLLRARDDRGMFGRGKKTLIVIFEPPKAPSNISIKNGDIIADAEDINRNLSGVQFKISGNSKPGVQVKIRTTAGVYSEYTKGEGRFEVSDVTLKDHGNNNLYIFAEDEAGNKSQEVLLKVVYNNPPVVKFINPRPGRGLNHKTNIEFSVYDPDGDSITKTVLSYKAPEDNNFRSLDINSVDGKFEFDVTNFKEDFGYELRLDSSDGVSSASRTIQFYVDNTPPVIETDPVKEKNFKKDFKFEATGRARDSLSGIEFVEYSLDEEHWFKAVISRGYLTNNANFRLKHPFSLDDGEYEIKIRSVDSAGNTSEPWFEKIRVDTMPPRMGGFEFINNNIVIYPENWVFDIVLNSTLDLKMSLESDTKEASVFVGDKEFVLSQNSSNGLWESKIDFKELGEFSLKFKAGDDFGNIVDGKRIGGIRVIENGFVSALSENGQKEIVPDAEISVLIFSEDEQKFIRWPGEYYRVSNPTLSSNEGKYSLFLPSGKFVINVKKSGFVNIATEEFVLPVPKFITAEFIMKKRVGLRGYVEDFLEKFIIF